MYKNLRPHPWIKLYDKSSGRSCQLKQRFIPLSSKICYALDTLIFRWQYVIEDFTLARSRIPIEAFRSLSHAPRLWPDP